MVNSLILAFVQINNEKNRLSQLGSKYKVQSFEQILKKLEDSL